MKLSMSWGMNLTHPTYRQMGMAKPSRVLKQSQQFDRFHWIEGIPSRTHWKKSLRFVSGSREIGAVSLNWSLIKFVRIVSLNWSLISAMAPVYYRSIRWDHISSRTWRWTSTEDLQNRDWSSMLFSPIAPFSPARDRSCLKTLMAANI
jgi:hypothetical protein